MSLDLTKGSIKEHIKTLAIPSSIGYFFHTMFNVTDTYFAGDISTEALASLSLSFSIFFTIIALAGGMSQGVSALIGNSIGEKDDENTKQILLHAFIFAFFLAVFITIIGLLSVTSLLEILGAHGTYLELAYSYISIIIYGAFLYVGVMFTNSLLNAIGDTKSYRNFLVGGFILNLILDFWFVKGGLGIEPQGIRGIAFATILIEAFGLIYLFYKLKKSFLFENLPQFKFQGTLIFAFLKQGLPATTNMVLMAFGMFVITYYISIFGQHVVAAYGIALRIEQIALLPSIGLNVAVLSIVSQNNGAKLYKRVKECVSSAQKMGFIIWIFGMIFILLFGKIAMGFFTDDSSVIDAGIDYLLVAAFSLYAYMLVFINIALLQGIKQPSLLVYLSLFRQLIIPALVFSVFRFFELPLVYYWIGIGAFIWLSALFILWYRQRKYKELQI